jgi:hypothetical protein
VKAMGRRKASSSLSGEEKAFIIEQYAGGTSMAAIARAIGRGANVPLLYLQRAGQWMRKRDTRRKSTLQSRGRHLSVEQRAQFVARLEEGCTYRQLTTEFGFKSLNDARLFAQEIGVLKVRLARQNKSGNERRCSRCKEEKDLSHFAKQVDKHGNYLCHPCHRAVMVKSRYGLTAARLDEMLRKQNGRCAICRELPLERVRKATSRRKNLAVDHDRTSGAIRELLCTGCNQALGLFHEDVERMESAIKYLVRARRRAVRAKKRL